MQDELAEVQLEALKARADRYGIKYHPSIGFDKLSEKIDEFVANLQQSNTEAAIAQAAEKFGNTRKDALQLIRVRIACMNPNKREYEGEIFSAANAVAGNVTKMVMYNTENGWHVPKIILDYLEDKMCQVFVTKKTARGQEQKEGKLIKEFAIEYLPALNAEELKELAAAQAARHAID